MAESLLAGLKARHEALCAEAASHDIPIPGWTGPTAYLRVHPVDHPTLRRWQDKARKAKPGAAGQLDMVAAAGVISAATEQVVFGDEDDPGRVEVELHDPRLLEQLGVEADASALTILRKLSLGRDGTLLVLSARISELSGYAALDADEDFAGE